MAGVLGAAPSWGALGGLAKQAAAALGPELAQAGRRAAGGNEGAPSAQSLLRTFGGSAADVRVVLYRDTHAWCPYCHKVWMQLEEKRLPCKCSGSLCVFFQSLKQKCSQTAWSRSTCGATARSRAASCS